MRATPLTKTPSVHYRINPTACSLCAALEHPEDANAVIPRSKQGWRADLFHGFHPLVEHRGLFDERLGRAVVFPQPLHQRLRVRQRLLDRAAHFWTWQRQRWHHSASATQHSYPRGQISCQRQGTEHRKAGQCTCFWQSDVQSKRILRELIHFLILLFFLMCSPNRHTLG